MNEKIKEEIILNEKNLLMKFGQYKQSINQFIKKIECVKYDGILYDLITRSFASKEKQEQENVYNMNGYKSSRQLINENKPFLNLNDRPNINNIAIGKEYTSLEICSIADNYNNQVGMYYLSGENVIIIKSTIEDNDRPYDDKWYKPGVILRYFMQNESEKNIKTLNFSHKPNSVIFNALMERELINIYVFVNKKKGAPYIYEGIYHPCGIISKNRAFLLFKDGYENEIPYDNLDGQFLMNLIYSNELPNNSTEFPLILGDSNDFFNYKINRIKTSKRTRIQQEKIDLEVELRGEELVIRYEKNKLLNLGRSDLAKLVTNVTLSNDNLGYDIKSFDIDEKGNVIDKFIKVKSSVSHKNLNFSLKKSEYDMIINKTCKLYRVYDIYTNYPKFIDISGRLLEFSKKTVMYEFY